MMSEMARMSCDDGLVMTVHPGVSRNHHTRTFADFGSDTGHDIPTATEYTTALQPLLERFGTHPNLHLVLFTVDADTFSREIAPLAGFYPRVFVGAPWWFLDNPTEITDFSAIGHRDRGLLQAFRIHRRHQGVLLDPGAARHVPPARRRFPRRTGRRAPTGSWTRPKRQSSRLVDDQPRKVFKL